MAGPIDPAQPAFEPGQAMELFPNASAYPRRRTLDTFFDAAAELFGAHAKDPRMFVHHEDAELALTTTVALFRRIGQRFDRAWTGR